MPGKVIPNFCCCGSTGDSTGGIGTCCCADQIPLTLNVDVTVGPPCNVVYSGELEYDDTSLAEFLCWRGEVVVQCGLMPGLCTQSRTISILFCCSDLAGCNWVMSFSCDGGTTSSTGTLLSESCEPFDFSFSGAAGAGNCTACPGFIFDITEPA